MSPKLKSAGLALALLAVGACGSGSRPPARRFDLRGKVVTVEVERKRVTIAHDAIPGYMEEMTMPFAVRAAEELAGVVPGDRIGATLVVDGDESWLEALSPLERSASGGSVLDVADPAPGTPVPALTLVDQDGEIVRLDAYRGKTLVVTFVYTRCPLPNYCARMTDNLAEIARALRAEPDLYDRTRLLSVSIDPEYDTPEVMRAYGERHLPDGARFDHWEFATGTLQEVRAAAGFFGLAFEPERGQIVHSLRTAVVGPDGRVFSVFRGNEWKTSEVVGDIRRASTTAS